MTVLLADDDIEMLESMRRMTLAMGSEWQIAGLAEDGIEALEILKNTPVDILVTDITMIDMDGLELIEKAKEYCPQLRSLLITCHENFQYAQEGIQLGVEDYLVKYTLTEAKFQAALTRTGGKIEAARRQNDSLTSLSAEVYKNREHFRQNLIHTLLNAPTAGEALAAKAPLYGITLPHGAFYVIAFYPLLPSEGEQPGEASLLRYALMNMSRELVNCASSFAFQWREAAYLLLWDVGQARVWRTGLKKQLEELRQHFEKSFGVGLCILAGNRQVIFSQFKEELLRLEGMQDAFFYGSPVLLEETANRRFTDEPVPAVHLETLQGALFDPPQFRQIFRSVCGQIQAVCFSPARVRVFFDKVVTQLQNVSRYSGQWIAHQPVDAMTLAACRLQVEKVLDSLEASCFWTPGYQPSPDVQRAVAYINAHLNTEVSLELVSRLLHKNSSYFSRQFKKETGFAFSEFLTRQRVQKATYFLEYTDFSIERIAGEVGIPNSKYFSVVYKKETGCSPNERRRRGRAEHAGD